MKTNTTLASTSHHKEMETKIDRLQSEIYDNLTLHREHLTFLSKLINTAIGEIRQHENNPAWAVRSIGTTLGIAQYLVQDFSYYVNEDLEASEAVAYPNGGAK